MRDSPQDDGLAASSPGAVCGPAALPGPVGEALAAAGALVGCLAVAGVALVVAMRESPSFSRFATTVVTDPYSPQSRWLASVVFGLVVVGVAQRAWRCAFSRVGAVVGPVVVVLVGAVAIWALVWMNGSRLHDVYPGDPQSLAGSGGHRQAVVDLLRQGVIGGGGVWTVAPASTPAVFR